MMPFLDAWKSFFVHPHVPHLPLAGGRGGRKSGNAAVTDDRGGIIMPTMPVERSAICA